MHYEIRHRAARRGQTIQTKIDAALAARDKALVVDLEMEYFALCDLVQRLEQAAEARSLELC